jgi:hypothetical protein
MRADGSGLRKIHTRTMNMEIAGHEFFSADGQVIWYDLQIEHARRYARLRGRGREGGERIIIGGLLL